MPRPSISLNRLTNREFNSRFARDGLRQITHSHTLPPEKWFSYLICLRFRFYYSCASFPPRPIQIITAVRVFLTFQFFLRGLLEEILEGLLEKSLEKLLRGH